MIEPKRRKMPIRRPATPQVIGKDRDAQPVDAARKRGASPGQIVQRLQNAPHLLNARDIGYLQRTIGNQALAHHLTSQRAFRPCAVCHWQGGHGRAVPGERR